MELQPQRHILATLASVVIACSLPVFVILLSLETVAFSPVFYTKQFRALNRPEATGFAEEDLMQASRALWDYFRGRRETPQLSLPKGGQVVRLYGERELAHLADVKRLFQLGLRLRDLSALLSILAALYLWIGEGRRTPRRLAGAVFWSSAVTLALAGVVLMLLVTDFNRWFTLFHVVSFSNDLWQLDPARENLIRIFPEEFFFAAARTAVLRSLATLALLTGAGAAILHWANCARV